MGQDPHSKPVVPARSEPEPRTVLRSNELLGRAREVLIDHGGTLYRLRITGTGKLILTK
jgi:hemin uptake protein HemP